MTPIPILKFKVLGRIWYMRILTKKVYKRKHGKDSLAVTKCWKREVDLSPRGLDLETIVHELVHCFLYEMCCKGSIESEGGLEEFYSELLARRGYELLNLAKKLRQEVREVTS